MVFSLSGSARCLFVLWLLSTTVSSDVKYRESLTGLCYQPSVYSTPVRLAWGVYICVFRQENLSVSCVLSSRSSWRETSLCSAAPH